MLHPDHEVGQGFAGRVGDVESDPGDVDRTGNAGGDEFGSFIDGLPV